MPSVILLQISSISGSFEFHIYRPWWLVRSIVTGNFLVVPEWLYSRLLYLPTRAMMLQKDIYVSCIQWVPWFSVYICQTSKHFGTYQPCGAITHFILFEPFWSNESAPLQILYIFQLPSICSRKSPKLDTLHTLTYPQKYYIALSMRVPSAGLNQSLGN